MMDKLKLKWRIFGFLICYCTLLLMILWLFQTVFLTDMYKWVREREITNAVSLVEENINNPKLPEILDEIKKNKEIFVTPSKDFIPSSKLEEKNSSC